MITLFGVVGVVGRLEADDEILPLLPLLRSTFICFSWQSFTECSSSTIRCRSHSTVRLSTVNWFGCSLPTLSSIGLSSKRNITGSDLYFSVKSLYSSAGWMLFKAPSILRWIFVWSFVVKSPNDAVSVRRFFLFLKIEFYWKYLYKIIFFSMGGHENIFEPPCFKFFSLF